MKKVMFTAFAVGLCLTANVMAQVPSYVPTNGLVGWWPFNGNANDESGNGNNGTVNGATLTTDRFGNVGKAYSFDGVNDNIRVTNSTSLNSSSVSISGWFNADILPVDNTLSVKGIIGKWWQSTSVCNSNYNAYLLCLTRPTGQSNSYLGAATNFYAGDEFFDNNGINTNNWIHFVFTHNSLIGGSLFINGVLVNSNSVFGSICNSINDLIFGADVNNGDLYRFFDGNIDDIGIWNRPLTDQEISALYNSCGNEITTQPSNAINTIGANAQFSVNAVTGSTYQWQSNPLNTGWLNLTNNSTYSGVTSNTLTISNTTISNHNQPFRAIVNAGSCIDTSDVAQIIIGDTCLTTVTDTLIINTTLGLPSPNNENTILIYPNPASDHITIDNGNYTAMAGYTIKIENNAGQQVFQSLINQAQFYVDLSTWSGNGLYFVHLIDAQGNTVTVRKIVLQ